MTTNLVGQTLDRKYLITDVLGEGGMGTVYKGEHVLLKRQCAVKVVLRRLAADPVALKRFMLEAQAASVLKHPNIIEIYDSGVTEDELPYIVMEYLPGESLDDVLGRHKFLHYEQAIPLFLQVCDALSHAHERKVLHRDLKPANIMIVNSENDEYTVKLVDFGIAKLLPGTGRSVDKLTVTGEIFGSPMYMSPEQCMGQALDARADIYAFGCVMFEILTGQLPFVGDSLFEVVMKHINEMPPVFADVAPDVAVPEELENIIMQCLSKERGLRYTNVNDLRKDLARIYTARQFKYAGAGACDESATMPSVNLPDSTVNLSRDRVTPRNEERTEDYYLAELERLKKQYGKNCNLLIAPLAELFRIYWDNNENAKALEVKQQELEIVKHRDKEDSLDAAYCYEDIGRAQLSLNMTAKAEASFRECLSILISVLGSDDQSTCMARINLANALRLRSRMSEAEELVQTAISKIYEKIGGKSLDTAEIEYQAGSFYHDTESWELAHLHYSKSAEILKEQMGNTFYDLHYSLMNMARCKFFLEDYDKAVEYAQEVIAIHQANPDRFDICFEYPWSILAWCYQNQHKLPEAEKASLKRIEIIESLPFEDNENLAAALELLADVYDEMGKHDKANQCRKRREAIDA